MPTITIEVPEDISELAARAGARLPEILALSLRQPVVSAGVYRHILDFIASQPTAEQIAAFGPTPEMRERLTLLLEREAADDLTPQERDELDEYERIEHLMIMIKAGNLHHLAGTPRDSLK